MPIFVRQVATVKIGDAFRAAALVKGTNEAVLVPRIGKEFVPPLNEGDLMFMPVTDPSISLPQAIEVVKKQNAVIEKFPEVASVVAKIARADTSTDPAPVNMTETIVSLKPEAQWRPGMTREKLIGEMDTAATLPGVSNIWTQPIINRINMLTTGIRSEVGVKVFGTDLTVLQERAGAVAEALRKIPGAADVDAEQVTGAPYLDVRVTREAAARYGITVGAIQDVIEARPAGRRRRPGPRRAQARREGRHRRQLPVARRGGPHPDRRLKRTLARWERLSRTAPGRERGRARPAIHVLARRAAAMGATSSRLQLCNAAVQVVEWPWAGAAIPALE